MFLIYIIIHAVKCYFNLKKRVIKIDAMVNGHSVFCARLSECNVYLVLSGCNDDVSECCSIFSRGSRHGAEERWRVATRLIKYATIISVSTAARSLSPSLRDAAKRSLFGSTDGKESAV